MEEPSLGDDLLIGGANIAQYLFGDRKKRRKVYYLRPRLPLFFIGSELAGRKSTLQNYIETKERAAIENDAA
jgi:hypothetical protein